MHAVTSRKCCGSCRFFEVGTVQGHGLCRNPDYQGRDDAVLLRAEELACRSGWQKDFWQASEDDQALNHALSQAALPAEQGSLPIGHGISSLTGSEATERFPKVTVPATRPASTAFPTARRRAGQPGTSGTLAPSGQPRSAQEPAGALGASLQGHPELSENGEVIRRPNRTMVAEAHRKALERREAERVLAVSRRQEQHEAALATIFPVAKPASITGATASTSGAGESPRIPEAPRTSQAIPSLPTASSGAFGLSGAPLPAEPSATATPALPREAVDRPLSVGHQAHIAASADRPGRIPDAQALPVASLGNELTTTATLPARRDPAPLPQAAAEPARATTPARYWDEPGVNGRFLRMRQEAPETTVPRPDPRQAATVQTPVQAVGRPRAEELPLPTEQPAGRTIRPLRSRGSSDLSESDTVPTPTQSPTRIPRPASAVTEVRAPEPQVPAMPPRQIDPQLVRQLQQDWREQALAAHSGQRCGTCRFFLVTGQSERGSCGCPLADCNRQAMGRQDLGCLTTFGTWWAADDAGWLQKADFGARQQTPLVDDLLREYGIPDAPQVAEERQRSAR